MHYFQMLLVKIYFCIFSRFNAIFPAARDPNFQAEEEDISTRDDHGAGVNSGRSLHFRLEQDPESILRSVHEPIKC